MIGARWQQAAIQALGDLLEADEGVRGLVLVGTCAQPDVELDLWSDVDAVLVVGDEDLDRFYPNAGWLASLGDVYASNASNVGPVGTIRAYFADGRRMDFVIVSEAGLEEADAWPVNPLRYGARCLFSRSSRLDELLDRGFPAPARKDVSQAQFDRIADDFWFKGMLAASKVARNDLLVALHLTLDMIRDCCVLGLMLRDRAVGTNHHRNGHGAEGFAALLEPAAQPYTAAGILDGIASAAVAFDRLAAEWADDYQENRGPLLAWVGDVREHAGTNRHV